jgi:hypothetical protein
MCRTFEVLALTDEEHKLRRYGLEEHTILQMAGAEFTRCL